MLHKSEVVFNEKSHEYILHSKRLRGVTPIVDWMFPKKYIGIPEKILKEAANFGSSVHKQCELADRLGSKSDSCRQVNDYLRLKEEYCLTTLENEYLVTDGCDIASKIDVVFTDYSLADIKTTSDIHYDNVRLQLSIYAYLFELNNPGLRVNKLYVIWLPKSESKKSIIKELERIDSDTCRRIIHAYLNDEDNEQFDYLWYDNKSAEKIAESDIPIEYADIKNEYIYLAKQKKVIDERIEQIKCKILKGMVDTNTTKWISDELDITFKSEHSSIRLDSTAVKKYHPEIFEKYQKVTTCKPSLILKIK